MKADILHSDKFIVTFLEVFNDQHLAIVPQITGGRASFCVFGQERLEGLELLYKLHTPTTIPNRLENMNLLGFHHISGITANIAQNHAFYTKTLGMRLVKRTVNQDDTSAYHLFYADQNGSPGSDVTFFDWANAAPERHGNHSISRTGLRVGSENSLEWWYNRLKQAGLEPSKPTLRHNRLTLDVSDAEGQRLALLADPSPDNFKPWDRHLPAEHAIRGLGAVLLTVPQLRPTAEVLTKVMNMQQIGEYESPYSHKHGVAVFQMASGGTSDQMASGGTSDQMVSGGAATELHLEVRPDLHPARPGAGGMHHVAFRVPDAPAHAAWLERLDQFGLRHSGLVDRYYFKAGYFREPNGILFELSTDDPGFAADEPQDHLGEHLALPPFLEGKRTSIEARLKPLEF
jgi:glyoxalase family protein